MLQRTNWQSFLVNWSAAPLSGSVLGQANSRNRTRSCKDDARWQMRGQGVCYPTLAESKQCMPLENFVAGPMPPKSDESEGQKGTDRMQSGC